VAFWQSPATSYHRVTTNFYLEFYFMSEIQEVINTEQLESLWQASHGTPVLFFKHSTTCPISTRAFAELQKYLESEASQQAQHALIIVQTARPVSNQLAERTGIKHESPQAILVRNGQAVWNESHFELKSHILADAVSRD
jgi:bacillithiol system protein YtxJ